MLIGTRSSPTENLHRAELTELERDEQLAECIALAEAKQEARAVCSRTWSPIAF